MKLVRVLGRWVRIDGYEADVLLNVDSIVRISGEEGGPSHGERRLALHLADGQLLFVAVAEWRRILRAAGATMPPSRPSKPRKP